MNARIPNDSPKTNGSRGPTQIMAEIDRTRDEMDQTLSAIEHRLTPGQLVDQGLDYLKNSGAREYATNLGASLKTNPLPATLCGIGLAWLMAVGNKPAQASFDSDASGIGDRMQSAKDSMSGGVQSAKDAMGSGMQSARDTAQSAKDSVTSGIQGARERASQLGDSAGRQLDRARENWDYMLKENPLVLGAVGLAIGAVVAALAPRTQAEDELMGEARDDLVDQAKRAGSEKLDQAKQAATEAASSAKDAVADAAKRQAENMSGPADKPASKDAGGKAPAAQAPSAVDSMDDSTWPARPKR